MLSKEQMQRVLEIADKELVTPRGLRTLSPATRFNKEPTEAIRKERDNAYHNGQFGHGFTVRSAKDGSKYTGSRVCRR